MEQEKNNAGMSPDKSHLLASRMVEHAMGYSWVKFGWETATKTYNTVKSSNRLTKYGCEMMEKNVSKVMGSALVGGTVDFLAPLIVIADEFGARQLDKVDKGIELTQKVTAPISSVMSMVTSVPSKVLDRVESFVDYYLPDEKRTGEEGPALAKERRDKSQSSIKRVYNLSCTMTRRAYSRAGYENLKRQVTEKVHSYETLNDLIIYMRTSDPEKREKLVRQGRDIYWNLRNNYRDIFVRYARSVVQPYLVSPAIRMYTWWNNTLRRIFLRGPFSPHLSSQS